jgi:hypothetical protein
MTQLPNGGKSTQSKPPVAQPVPSAPVVKVKATKKKGTERWLAGSKVEKTKAITNTIAKNIPNSAVITLLVKTNPKRRGSALRFAKYRDGMTVAAYGEAIGSLTLAKLDAAWDYNHGFINLTELGEFQFAATAAA